MHRLPRVLFCTSEIPQSINAGSMQLYRVMQGYAAEKLMVLGAPPAPGAELLPCRYEPLRLLTYRLACTRVRGWTIGLNSMNTLIEPGMENSGRRTAGFQPEVVVTVMDKLSYYKHAWALSRRLGAALVTITMDNPQTFERAHPLFDGSFANFLRRMYGDAAVSLGVSHEMCEYLASHFGKPSTVFYFGPPEGMHPRHPPACAILKAPPALTLAYAGSMSLGYGDGIRAILPALEATKTRLCVYTGEPHNLVRHPLLIGRGYLTPENLWPAIQAECDAVLMPYSYEAGIAEVYRTHFPTKVSEYCWTGMPMIFSGPEYATGVRWAKAHPKAALVAASELDLTRVLRRLREDSGLRIALAAEGAKTGRMEFAPGEIRSRFWQILQSAARLGLHAPVEESRSEWNQAGQILC